MVVQRERTTAVQRGDGDGIVVRKDGADGPPDGALHLRLSNFRVGVVARDHHGDAVLAVPLLQRGGQTAGAAHRGHVLARHHHDGAGRLERVENGRIGPRYVDHHVGEFPGGQSNQRLHTRGVERHAHDAVGRGQQVQPRLRLRHQAAEKCPVHPIHVLEGVDNREPRLGGQEHTRISVGHVEIHQQCGRGTQLAQDRRDVDGHRRRADAALRADHGKDLAVLGCRTLRGDPLERVEQLLARHWFGNAFVHAGTHGFQKQRSVEAWQHHQHAGRRVQALHRGDFGRNGAAIPLIDDHHIRLASRRLRERRQPLHAQRDGVHTAGSHELDEVPVGTRKNADIHDQNSAGRDGYG